MQGMGGQAPGLNRGASMSGNKAGASVAYASAISFGQTSWTAPFSGRFKFILKGGGGNATSTAAGGGGAGAEVSVFLAKGQVLICIIGGPGTLGGIDAQDTTLTLPMGFVVMAGGGKSGSNGGAGGVAIGGDLNVAGKAAVSASVGGDGPTVGDFPGAPTNTVARNPGVGAGASYVSATLMNGGVGEIYIMGV